jgi:Putative MetA-pathway of phenol degradation
MTVQRLGALVLALTPALAAAHHGVASLGAAGLEGPGAPVVTSSAAPLPKGSGLLYLKADYADYETFTSARDRESDYDLFSMAGVGYGFTSWFSAYAFLPYNVKSVESGADTPGGGSKDQQGFADISFTGVLAFKYDDGFKLVPERESLDDLEDWHFSAYAGLSVPTGDADALDAAGAIDPGQATGFGAPSFSVGLTSSKQITDRDTWINEISYLWFSENEYDDGSTLRFGSELRLNTAWVRKLYANADSKFRLDGLIEANYLSLGRDQADGRGEDATGGQILYLTPGVRLYKDRFSIALGVMLPAWKNLNEEGDQQGSEGLEDYRLVGTFSYLF